MTSASVLAILDTEGRVFASAGSARQQWPVNEKVMLSARESTTFQTVAVVAAGAFRASGAPLRLDDRDVGTLVLGTSLDDDYAEILAGLSRAGIVITREPPGGGPDGAPRKSRAISWPTKASRARRLS